MSSGFAQPLDDQRGRDFWVHRDPSFGVLARAVIRPVPPDEEEPISARKSAFGARIRAFRVQAPGPPRCRTSIGRSPARAMTSVLPPPSLRRAGSAARSRPCAQCVVAGNRATSWKAAALRVSGASLRWRRCPAPSVDRRIPLATGQDRPFEDSDAPHAILACAREGVRAGAGSADRFLVHAGPSRTCTG